MGESAVVVGGGVARLAAVIALCKIGWRLQVLEQAEELGDVGAAISLWPNALRVLDALDLGNEVRRTGTPGKLGGLRESNGRWLMRADGAPQSRYEPPIPIRRADLIDILVCALPRDVMQAGAKVHHVHNEGGRATVEDCKGRGGGTVVVGADGIHSVVRGSLFPEARPPRYAGHTCWRFITKPFATPVELTESWGAAKGSAAANCAMVGSTATPALGFRGRTLQRRIRRSTKTLWSVACTHPRATIQSGSGSCATQRYLRSSIDQNICPRACGPGWRRGACNDSRPGPGWMSGAGGCSRARRCAGVIARHGYRSQSIR